MADLRGEEDWRSCSRIDTHAQPRGWMTSAAYGHAKIGLHLRRFATFGCTTASLPHYATVDPATGLWKLTGPDP
jgi:hypothetical protein